MSDCSNAEIRDLLPDLVHETLTVANRGRVVAHVAVCEICTSEVALLRGVRSALSGAPTVNVASIVSLLPPPGLARSREVPVIAVRRQATRWRMAAGLIVAVGVSSALLLRGHRAEAPVVASTAPRSVRVPVSAPVVNTPPATSPAPVPPVPNERRVASIAVTRAPQLPTLGLGTALADLSDHDLQTLMADIDAMRGQPSAEPESYAPVARAPGNTGTGL